MRRARFPGGSLASLPTASNEQQLQGNQFLTGYEEEFVSAVDEDLTCPVCQLPLRSPVLTSCGHRFCKGCIDEICRRENISTRINLYAVLQVTCPVDRTKLERHYDVFPDKFTERKILSLVIKCSKKGCEWTGELKEKENHKKCCPEEVVKCTNVSCTETMTRRSLEEHVTATCQWRMIRCGLCSIQHPASEQSEHQSTCKRFPVNCFWNCGQVIPREEQRNHREICPEQIVGCTSDGCTDIMARKNLEEHVTTTCQWRMICCEHCSIQHPACVQSEHQLSKCKRFPVNCPLKCGQVMPREEIINHREICPEEFVGCTNDCCPEITRRKYLEKHVTTRCKKRNVTCEHCSIQHPAYEQWDHQLNCKRFPVTCPYNCGEEIPREEMEAHFDTVCPIVIVSCPFAEMDCQTKVRRSELSSHIQTATNDHLDLARTKLTKAFEEHEELKQCTRLLEEKLDNTLKEHEELKKTTRKLEEKLNYTVHVLLTMKN